ncbi:MAG: hypothetical protein CSA62_14240 [Planctomycetota bacterium]|nr:MAG: hypothetical protein CSA62_14240 [Planctomycetota bacterium]
MRVLQLYSNYKWTGPADLALLQTKALMEHAPEVDVRFALSAWTHPGEVHAMRRRAEELGLDCVEGLQLRRHYHLPTILGDASRLARLVDDEKLDVLHCHQSGDHFLAALAAGQAVRRVAIVRSFWEERIPLRVGRMLFAFQRSDALIGPFAGRVRALGQRFDLPAGRVHLLPPILDASFDLPSAEERDSARRSLLSEFGIEGEPFLIGLTARIQRKRRWDLAWDTIQELVRKVPAARLCVLGRPDEGVFDEICRAPVMRRGLSEQVLFLGYRRGAEYRRALAAFDAFLFLVAGSDATSRALREAMASGLPPVVTDAAPLPEIVGEGRFGALSAADPAQLARALRELAESPDLRAERSARAREAAMAWSDAAAQAAALSRIYVQAREGYPG